MGRLTSEIKVSNLDLNLLVSLDALLQERSVSRAATRLGLSQPALSGAVAQPKQTEAAVVTFVVTASGVSFLGIGGALWGLVAGGAMLLLAVLVNLYVKNYASTRR